MESINNEIILHDYQVSYRVYNNRIREQLWALKCKGNKFLSIPC